MTLSVHSRGDSVTTAHPNDAESPVAWADTEIQLLRILFRISLYNPGLCTFARDAISLQLTLVTLSLPQNVRAVLCMN
jgi:hypothetical protein